MADLDLPTLLGHVQRILPYNRLLIGAGGITTADFLDSPAADAMRQHSGALYHSHAPTITGPAMLLALEGAVIDTACTAYLLSTHTPDLTHAHHLIANHYGQGVAFPVGTALHHGALGERLTTRLTHTIGLVAAFAGVRQRVLWPAAADRVVGALINAGRAIGWPPDALLAEIQAIRKGTPLETRFTGVYVVGGQLHLRRAACCHLDRTGAPLCDNCPQRPEAERLAALRSQ